VVVVNFWATWSGPCKTQWPSLVALQSSLAGQTSIVFLSVDLSEPYGVVRAFLSDNPANFPVLLDADGVTGNSWGVQSLPTTVVIDRQGRIMAGKTGVFAWDKPEVLAGLKQLAGLP
jgi:thiol-disulfide isomerase/thioredoxin